MNRRAAVLHLLTALRAIFLVLCFGAAAAAAELNFDIAIRHGSVADDMRLIRVRQGDTVNLRCTSDRPVTLHLHGYDIERQVAAGGTADISFTAYATGRFPLHLHAAGKGAAGGAHDEAPLVVLEVYPR